MRFKHARPISKTGNLRICWILCFVITHFVGVVDYWADAATASDSTRKGAAGNWCYFPDTIMLHCWSWSRAIGYDAKLWNGNVFGKLLPNFGLSVGLWPFDIDSGRFGFDEQLCKTKHATVWHLKSALQSRFNLSWWGHPNYFPPSSHSGDFGNKNRLVNVCRWNQHIFFFS